MLNCYNRVFLDKKDEMRQRGSTRATEKKLQNINFNLLNCYNFTDLNCECNFNLEIFVKISKTMKK